jgi:hypothetical protein
VINEREKGNETVDMIYEVRSMLESENESEREEERHEVVEREPKKVYMYARGDAIVCRDTDMHAEDETGGKR